MNQLHHSLNSRVEDALRPGIHIPIPVQLARLGVDQVGPAHGQPSPDQTGGVFLLRWPIECSRQDGDLVQGSVYPLAGGLALFGRESQLAPVQDPIFFCAVQLGGHQAQVLFERSQSNFHRPELVGVEQVTHDSLDGYLAR